MNKILVGALIVVAGVFMFSVSSVMAQTDLRKPIYSYAESLESNTQDFCKGDFNYNGSVAAEDVTEFLNHFGRNPFNEPCPPDGPTPPPKTGQWISYATGDDGDLRRGVSFVTPRFTDNGNGTVTDNQTGLIWMKDANCIATNYPSFDNDDFAGDGNIIWQHALDFVASINDGTYPNCGAGYADWRLPNYRELLSLTVAGHWAPALPFGHPFTNVQDFQSYYWSSTTHADDHYALAWYVNMTHGSLSYGGKNNCFCVWPVRGGH